MYINIFNYLVPMEAPQNIQIIVLNSTVIEVSFDSPEQQMIPGVNLGYKVTFFFDF